ncbi:MAG: electron transport complex subunit RsxC [Zoogloeaceae bacterium]|jgi:electron transport complex protein RnfC|nr:electron transport complex subunit RsxC [Zoogloeaceae bacterium]
MSLKDFFFPSGGLHLPAHKAISSETPILSAPLPEKLVIPLSQSAGEAARPVVAVGDRVLKGQRIGEAEASLSVSAHASTSGKVVDIGLYPSAHPSGLATQAVVIVPDGEERWIDKTPIPWQSLSPDRVRRALQAAGVAGLGGAVFPTHAKLPDTEVTTLVINGAECEPYITCDDRLMRERAAEILEGVGILRDLLAARTVLVGIEDNKPEAITAMCAANAAADLPFQIVAVPSRYPTGDARQLIHALTGIRIPATRRSVSLGFQVFNVATAFTVARAVLHGEPVTARVVTLTGHLSRPGNRECLIGTPVRNLIAQAEPEGTLESVVMGGPMMGFALPSLDVPIVKASNCLIARLPETSPATLPEMPCIRCGACARACPQGLQPFELYRWSRAREFGQVERYQLASCIECGCCAYVCPAQIPLVQYFRFARGEIRSRAEEAKVAEGARARFEFRQFREARDKAEKAEKLARAAAAQAAKVALEAELKAVDPEVDASKKALIAAALERARQSREEHAPAAGESA